LPKLPKRRALGAGIESLLLGLGSFSITVAMILMNPALAGGMAA
jgi:hypothetical protein